MKKILAVCVASLLTSTPIFSKTIQLQAIVPSVCTTDTEKVHFELADLTKNNSASASIYLRCNHYQGATIKLSSSNGHLKNGNEAVKYTATLKLADTFAKSSDLVMNTGFVNAGENVQGQIKFDNDLARGKNIEIELNLNEKSRLPAHKGKFTDTVIITMDAGTN